MIRMIKWRRIIWEKHVARMGRKRNVYRVLVRKSEGRRPLVRLRGRWRSNIKMDLREIVWGGMDRIHLPQDREQRMAL
jgi:hypothetical protein